MHVELPKMYQDKYGKQLPDITPEVLQEMSSKASAVLVEALLNTRNRNCFMLPFMRLDKYRNPRSEDWVLVWAAMHDERGTIIILDADVPESFRNDVRKHWAQHLEEFRASAASGSAVAAVPPNVSSESVQRGEVDLAIVCGAMLWMLTYSCGYCLVAGKAMTGLDVNAATASRSHRWGCLNCSRNCDREHQAAVVVELVMDGKSYSLYSYRPLSEYVKTSWPEVYSKASHLGDGAHDVVLEVRRVSGDQGRAARGRPEIQIAALRF